MTEGEHFICYANTLYFVYAIYYMNIAIYNIINLFNLYFIHCTLKFSSKDFFGKCDQICRNS